jgi:hypothetical protein
MAVRPARKRDYVDAVRSGPETALRVESFPLAITSESAVLSSATERDLYAYVESMYRISF